MVTIKGKNKTYDIVVGSGVINQLPEFLSEKHEGKKIVIITDENVKAACAEKVLALFENKPFLITIKPGEESKCRKVKEQIEDELFNNKFGRDTVLVALGGGVVGDIVGYVAATFNRGVPLIQVPTSLLAMVDSAIGGKTGIDIPQGKNLVGAIYQPDIVISDIDFLSTLPEEEFVNGMAEVIKTACIKDKELFEYLENNTEQINEQDPAAVTDIVQKCADIKGEVVEKDEKEAGLRQILNYGHTIGHAVEAHAHFSIKHGQCVSIGIVAENELAVNAGMFKKEEADKIKELLDTYGLQTELPTLDAEKVFDIMLVDKKTKDGTPRVVVLEKIGKAKSDNNYSQPFTKEQMLEVLK